MFGYVLLGGDRLKAFFWETDSPAWLECVVLYSEQAVQHEVVSLHFRVLAERAFLDADVEPTLTQQDSKIVETCQRKLAQNEKIGRRVRFSSVDFIDDDDEQSEFFMQMEVQRMMEEDTDDDEFFSDECDELGCFYEAEVFGGRFIDSETESSLIRKTSSMKQHCLEQIINDQDLLLSEKLSSCLACDFDAFRPVSRLPTLTTPVDPELSYWEMDMGDEYESDSDNEDIFEPADKNERRSVLKQFSNTEPFLDGSGNLRLLERQPAFISTKGKEKEIWATYRDEITATWKADLEKLRHELALN